MSTSKFITEIKERQEELEAIGDMTVIQAIGEQIRQDIYWLDRDRFSLGRKISKHEKLQVLKRHKQTHKAYCLMLDGLSISEIANHIGVPKNKIYKLLRNAPEYLVSVNRTRGYLINVARSADYLIRQRTKNLNLSPQCK